MKKILTTPMQYKGRSGSTGRILLFFGLFFIFVSIFLKIISVFIKSNSSGFLKSLYEVSISYIPESLAALGIVIVFFSLVLFFFCHQFSKLADIAEEIENSEEYCEEKFD